MRLFCVLVVLLSASGTAILEAQTRSPALPNPAVVERTGSVTGHVFCGDTNQPARFAQVSLEASLPPGASTSYSSSTPLSTAQSGGRVGVQTSIDGSFTLSGVKTGTYFVIVEKQGYINPRAMFTQKEIDDPAPDIRSMIDHVLPRVIVEANQVEHAEVRLERGAAISGTLRYDDGSPAGEIHIQLLHKDAAGKWVSLSGGGRFRAGAWVDTDDRGNFRLSSLLPDEYILQADLSLADSKTSFIPGPNGNIMQVNFSVFRSSISYYGSGVSTLSDATSFKLLAGQELGGQDMFLPISKLHRITGHVVAGRDGHIVNAASLSLVTREGQKEVSTATVLREDGLFHFDFVPAGDYILRINNARDVVWEAELPDRNAPPNPFPAKDKERVLQAYGSGEQPLLLHGDMLGMVATVPPEAKPDAKANAGTPSN